MIWQFSTIFQKPDKSNDEEEKIANAVDDIVTHMIEIGFYENQGLLNLDAEEWLSHVALNKDENLAAFVVARLFHLTFIYEYMA